jgi:hypothetical protein
LQKLINSINFIYIDLFLLPKIGCVSTSISAGSRYPAVFGVAVLLLDLGVNLSVGFDALVCN